MTQQLRLFPDSAGSPILSDFVARNVSAFVERVRTQASGKTGELTHLIPFTLQGNDAAIQRAMFFLADEFSDFQVGEHCEVPELRFRRK